jgi:SAM-dependent methyltransferase
LNTDDNLSEYADPVLYDLENQKFEPDGPFLLALAQRLGGPVLELGSGTGRLTIPFAQRGLDMTGLDLVPGMLARARTKGGELPIQWIEADVRHYDLDRRFGFIFETGAIFQHMLTRADQEAFLARARAHLAPQGHLALGALVPGGGLLESDPVERDWFSYTGPEGQTVRVSGTQHYDPVTQLKTETAYRRWQLADGQAVVRVAPLRLRYTYPPEMEALLRGTGFTIVERYGGFDFSPLTEDSTHQLYVCQPA